MDKKIYDSNVTRGYGLLEGILAKKRCEIANKFIPNDVRKGRILDIGCGSYPFFLMNTQFAEKYGIDKSCDEKLCLDMKKNNISVINHDIEKDGISLFKQDDFDIITMLATFEHIETDRLGGILREAYRVLKPGGRYIMTTPAFWTDRLLRVMVKLRLVSAVEIEEHKDAYSTGKISLILENAGFSRQKTRFKYFELFMNICAVSVK